MNQPTAKRVISTPEEDDGLVLGERAALTKDRAKTRLGILSNAPTRKLGKAYLTVISDAFPEPTGATFHKSKRTTDEQSRFKKLLYQAYNPVDAPEVSCWCPVTSSY